MKKKCPNCNGTGNETCEIHGSHECGKCNGRGCIEEFFFPNPKFTFPQCPEPNKYWC